MVKPAQLNVLFCMSILLSTIALAADTRTYEPTDPDNKYTKIVPEALKVIAAGEAAFADQDAAAAGSYLAEDYSWYHITEEGPVQMISGRQKTVELLETFFQDDSWQGSEVHRLGMLDNILVQVEIDTLQTDSGPEVRRSITIYEFRNGERWREWKFYPSDQDSW